MIERRTLIIEERESLTSPRTLNALHVVYLPAGYDVDPDDVTEQIRIALDEAAVGDGFSISDERSWFEHGASSSNQTVILALAEVAAGKAIEVIVGKLMDWVKERIEQDSREPSDSLPEPSADKSHMLAIVETYLKENFGAVGNVVATSQSYTDAGFRAEFRDSHGTRWEVYIEGEYMQPGGRFDVRRL